MPTLQLSFEASGKVHLVDILHFSGAQGTVPDDRALLNALSKDGILKCELKLSELGSTIWSGPVRFCSSAAQQVEFALLLQSSSGEVAEWGALPRFFSIADGGYEPLGPESVGSFLNDLLQFPDVTKTILFLSSASQNQNTTLHPCTVEMENIASTDAILLHLHGAPPSSHDLSFKVPAVVSVELFEVTYILIGFIEEIEGQTAIFALTGHTYRDQRHAGRRFLEPPVSTPQGEIIEISDFGTRLRCPPSSAHKTGDLVRVQLPDIGSTEFRVVHAVSSQSGGQEIGCMVQSDPASSSNWIRFLLREQYPLLRFRSANEHPAFWGLLEETGFTTKEFSELNQLTRPMVEKEWAIVDEECPTLGGTVMAMDGAKPVGTFGVTRVGKNAWNSGLLATSKDPKLLPQTRSLFAWRTRFMLQQQDCEYNIAFFSRDKVFLDRFYRKFFLQVNTDHPEDLLWDEWHLYTKVVLPGSEKSQSSQLSPLNTHEPRALLSALAAGGEHDCSPKTKSVGEATIIMGRPFQHLCQYFSSAWIPGGLTADISGAIEAHLEPQRVVTVRTKKDLSLLELQTGPNVKLIDDGWDVVWVCRRNLLLRFMANSLRALELMQKKYGVREVA